MATAVYRNKGETIEYTNPSSENALAAGDIVDLTSRVGVAAIPIEASGTGIIHVVGVFIFPKTTSLEIAQGDALYFNTTSGKVTKTNTDVPCGYAVTGAASAATEVIVKLLG